MYTLYGSPGSGSAMVEMALNAAGLDARHVRASTWEPGPALDELQRVNPLGQIPTLVLPDGQVMTESAAILIHLGLLAPPGCLLPADAALETGEKILPVHSDPSWRKARPPKKAPKASIKDSAARGKGERQSRRSSLIDVLERVFSSTRLTITAHARPGPPSLPGRTPGTTTE